MGSIGPFLHKLKIPHVLSHHYLAMFHQIKSSTRRIETHQIPNDFHAEVPCAAPEDRIPGHVVWAFGEKTRRTQGGDLQD